MELSSTATVIAENTVPGFNWAVHNMTQLNLLTGEDEFGKILAEKAKEAGVRVNYLIHDKEPTGTCAVCITGKHRYLFEEY